MQYKIQMDDKNYWTVNLDGKDYWSIPQFSALTGRSEYTLRQLITKGNRIRKMRATRFNGRVFVEAEELFEFPFVVAGRPSGIGEYADKFYLDSETNELLKEECVIERCK